MKDFNSFEKTQSKIYTETYVNHLKSKDINNICLLYLESKVFRDKTRTFLINRWSDMTDDKIIDDLLSVNNGIIYNYPFPENRKYTSLSWICISNSIDIIPINILKKLPMTVWDEQVLDTHHSNDMNKYEIKTLKDFLLEKKKTPQEIKDYLK